MTKADLVLDPGNGIVNTFMYFFQKTIFLSKNTL